MIENAINHGIALHIDENGQSIPGKIDILIEHLKGTIRIMIKDNGIGMSEETIEQYFHSTKTEDFDAARQHEHIGTKILLCRLEYLYGSDYKVSVESKPGEGTAIWLQFPDTQIV